MAQSNLISWANSVRMAMANDPGRKLFQEQVQTYGFSFLDDYLDNILCGAKQDPLIELVKTPGRKKAISRKPVLTSKPAKVVTMLSEDNTEQSGKENLPPVDREQRTANTKGGSPPAIQPASAHQENVAQHISHPREERGKEQPVDYRPISAGPGEVPPTPDHLSTSHQELSVIAEGDEDMERTRMSIQPVQMPTPDNQDQPPATTDLLPLGLDREEISKSEMQGQSGKDIHRYLNSSADTFHSMPLELDLYSKDTEKAMMVDITVPIQDDTVAPAPSQPLMHKNVLPVPPTLPEPMPLRKSMRATRDPAAGSTLFNAVTPGTGVGGKRTSWLMKAREVKAREDVSKKSNVISQPAPTVLGVKRKSGEMVDDIQEDNEPSSKKLKENVASPSDSSLVLQSNKIPTNDDQPMESNDDGMLNLLKKKVFEVRSEKYNNKAHGDAAAALAEDRAKAEARIAERNHTEEIVTIPVPEDAAGQTPPASQPLPDMKVEAERRLSISDLFPMEGRVKDKSKPSEKVSMFHWRDKDNKESPNESVSTTPPHSPPARLSSATLPAVPASNKPPPVFIPPASSGRPLPTPPSVAESIFNVPAASAFSKPASMALGILPRLPSPPSTKPVPLTAQSTTESISPDVFFDYRGDTEAWVPNTQDTNYSSALESQQQRQSNEQTGLDEDDDSWPIDEKISQGAHWPFGVSSKEDSMTWSTLPSQSQRADTGTASKNQIEQPDAKDVKEVVPDRKPEADGQEPADQRTIQDSDLEGLVLDPTKPTVTLVKPQSNYGHVSPTSSVSSQSQGGFFNQATKFFSNALGSSKKNKPEIKKVLQMAAVAAKKQQEEDDRKAARLKEMESRRQLAVQRKAEEERTKLQEQERKAREESERRKREREEQPEKKPLKPMPSFSSFKKEEETVKKRKVEQDKSEKKIELKKQASGLHKSGFKPASSKQASILSSSTTYNTSQSQQTATNLVSKTNEPMKQLRIPPVIGKHKPLPIPASDDGEHSQSSESKNVSKVPIGDEESAQPSQIIQSQMAARVEAAMQPESERLAPSESIELPDVRSEYSDSDDEDRKRTFDPPNWAQPSELRQALEAQSTINPDDIFGAIRPLRMEEIFKARTSRFRARTSSANWSGADRLTLEEEREYARRMGFK